MNDLEFGLSMLLKVKFSGSVGLSIQDFLLMSNSNHMSISHRFTVIYTFRNFDGVYANVVEAVMARYIIRQSKEEEINSNYCLQVKVHCPQVQHVERILLTKYTLIAAIQPNDTHCAAFDYVGLTGFIVMLIHIKVFSQSNLFLTISFLSEPGRSDSIFSSLLRKFGQLIKESQCLYQLNMLQIER